MVWPVTPSVRSTASPFVPRPLSFSSATPGSVMGRPSSTGDPHSGPPPDLCPSCPDPVHLSTELPIPPSSNVSPVSDRPSGPSRLLPRPRCTDVPSFPLNRLRDSDSSPPTPPYTPFPPRTPRREESGSLSPSISKSEDPDSIPLGLRIQSPYSRNLKAPYP